jgi:superfamily I DNA/RNA helicase
VDDEESAIPAMHHVDGTTFDGHIEAMGAQLSVLTSEERVAYRNANATAIAKSTATHVLVVAGPGSGKSHLFMDRARHWLDTDEDGHVLVSTFVRKLIGDLRSDIAALPPSLRKRVEATTVHGLARGLIERGRGSPARPRRRHVRIIDRFWSSVVWSDVFGFRPELSGDYREGDFKRQLYSEVIDSTEEWPWVHEQYEQVCRFYNAVGFADSIAIAIEAVEADDDLATHDYWIVDEYQDLNTAEDHLIRATAARAKGVLLAGDDDQALYQELKLSLPEIITGYYADSQWAKGMLPFCSRCDRHICDAASEFVRGHRDAAAIAKLYLPLRVDGNAEPVHVVGTAAPTSAIDYIRRFLEERSDEYDEYMVRRAAGDDSDPFLLILSQSGRFSMGKNLPADDELEVLLAEYSDPVPAWSADYQKISGYCIAGWDAYDNFAMRKVLHFEDMLDEDIHNVIAQAMEEDRTLRDVVREHDPHLIHRMLAVTAVLEGFDQDPDYAMSELDRLLQLDDVDGLRQELEQRPIQQSGARDVEDEEAVETADLGPPVQAMSVVGSKGLSAHHVIVIGCDDLNMGHVTPLAFFVAMTRARKTLHLVTSLKAGGQPHNYLAQLPAASCDYSVYKKSGRVLEAKANWASLARYLSNLNQFAGRGRQRG